MASVSRWGRSNIQEGTGVEEALFLSLSVSVLVMSPEAGETSTGGVFQIHLAKAGRYTTGRSRGHVLDMVWLHMSLEADIAGFSLGITL